VRFLETDFSGPRLQRNTSISARWQGLARTISAGSIPVRGFSSFPTRRDAFGDLQRLSVPASHGRRLDRIHSNVTAVGSRPLSVDRPDDVRLTGPYACRARFHRDDGHSRMTGTHGANEPARSRRKQSRWEKLVGYARTDWAVGRNGRRASTSTRVRKISAVCTFRIIAARICAGHVDKSSQLRFWQQERLSFFIKSEMVQKWL